LVDAFFRFRISVSCSAIDRGHHARSRQTRTTTRGALPTRLAAAGVAALMLSLAAGASAEPLGPPEKEDLKLGFIKLTDMAPLAIAYEKGFFEDEDSSSPWRLRPIGRCCWTA
jgi:hypothetical protein